VHNHERNKCGQAQEDYDELQTSPRISPSLLPGVGCQAILSDSAVDFAKAFPIAFALRRSFVGIAHKSASFRQKPKPPLLSSQKCKPTCTKLKILPIINWTQGLLVKPFGPLAQCCWEIEGRLLSGVFR